MKINYKKIIANLDKEENRKTCEYLRVLEYTLVTEPLRNLNQISKILGLPHLQDPDIFEKTVRLSMCYQKLESPHKRLRIEGCATLRECHDKIVTFNKKVIVVSQIKELIEQNKFKVNEQ